MVTVGIIEEFTWRSRTNTPADSLSVISSLDDISEGEDDEEEEEDPQEWKFLSCSQLSREVSTGKLAPDWLQN